MPPFSSIVTGEIRLLLQGVNASNFDAICHELFQFADNGNEGSILLLQTCLSQLALGDAEIQHQKRDLLSTIIRYLLDRPNFSAVLCETLKTMSVGEGFLDDISVALGMSVAEKIGLGLALSDSENPDLRIKGQNFCIGQIQELCATSSAVLRAEQIQDIVIFLYQTEGVTKHMDSFTKLMSLVQLKGSSFFLPISSMSNDVDAVNYTRSFDLLSKSDDSYFNDVLAEIEREMSMADVFTELGYGCTLNASHCVEILSQFQPFNEVTIAKLLGTLAFSSSGFEETHCGHAILDSALDGSINDDSSSLNSWDVDVLVDSIKQLAPMVNWSAVMENLDHDGFNVPDATAFALLISIYSRGCQEPFPLNAICGSVWRNTEGQLSFLRYAVSAPPEIFTFAHCTRQLVYPNLGYLNRGNHAWFSLGLLDILCQLAERGHATSIRVMLDYPLTHYPEILILGVSHISTAYNLIQHEVLSAVFPTILKDSSMNNIIHHMWQTNSDLVVRGFIDVHTDSNIFLRIFDMCQEFKILSSVLAAAPFSFSIKLAAIASAKEVINFENWLNDNLSTSKDAFFEQCLKFLKDVANNGATEIPDSSVQQSHAAIMSAYQDACPVFFKVLQAYSSQLIVQQPFEETKRLYSFNQKAPNTGTTESVSNVAVSDDVEADANSYLHQMFSGKMTIDSMIQMLTHLKESSEKREQIIFEYIIRNLFAEYKFFPKYPDRQLKLVAVVFGSLIKHQLVTQVNLGMALRGILDALRQSVDSKMFTFGTKALEQFTDRLVEWPKYCNHILQISHLRAAHGDLVSFVEHALSRISSSQLEKSDSKLVQVDQQSSSVASSIDNIEASEASWQVIGSASAQLSQQLSSSQLQQRHQGFLDERLKASTGLASYTDPMLSHPVQSSIASGSTEPGTSQKPVQSSPHPVASATSALSSSTSSLRSRSVTNTLRQPSYSTGFGAALNIETLVAAAERRDIQIESPSSEIQDKILFMINNISTTNMDTKAKEFDEVLKEQYYPWFAQYMVMKRASIEPNFHELYLKFLDKVNSKSLNKEILKATYENCKVLLRSDLIKSSSEERSLLKNLGSWLGKFTIGRNQALRAKEIDPKTLIIEAYEKGLMIAVIPFTSKILEPCQSSLAYQPPNPWTMGILNLLTEIYNLPNLKMNLKFDIEVLFKNLGVDIKEVKSTSLLKNKARELEGNPDFSNKDNNAGQSPPLVDVNSGMIPSSNHMETQPEVNNLCHPANHLNVLSQYAAPLNLASSTMLEDDKAGALNVPERVPSGQGLAQVTPSPSPSPATSPSPSPFSLNQLMTIIPNADSYININPKLSSMGSLLQFQRIIQAAMDRSIKEIVSPVIQRSVTIASRTTKELVLKDYAMETDDGVISRAAHLMVGTLAGSLAHVTCKEPLRVSLSSHLKSLLHVLNVTTERMDQVVQILTTDHLDLGCAVIENVASEKAVELIDGEIGPAFAGIRKQKEGTGSAYYDVGAYAQGPYARVPDALRPKPGRLSLVQQRVYDEFIKNLWQNQPSQSLSSSSSGPSGIADSAVKSSLSRIYGSNSSPQSSSVYSTSQVVPFSSVSQPSDLISEDKEQASTQLLSVFPTHGLSNDSVISHGGEFNSMVASFPSTVVPSALQIDLGAVAPPPPALVTDQVVAVLPDSLFSTGEALEKYQQVAQKLEVLVAKDASDAEIQGVVAEVPDIILRCVSRDEASLAVAQKVFRNLYENASNGPHVACHLAILASIRDVCKLLVKELTSWVIYSDEERKFNKEITIGLVRSELLDLAEYNVHLSKLIDGGRNKAATEFAISLVQTLFVQEPAVSMSELYNLMDALTKLAMRPGSPESLQQLIEIAKNTINSPPNFSTNKDEKARQLKDKKIFYGRSLTNRQEPNVSEPVPADPPGFLEQVAAYFSEWSEICDLPANDLVFSHYISQLQQNNFLLGDDTTDRFFHILMELSVSQCLLVPDQLQSAQHISFSSVDSYAKLVIQVLKYCSLDQGAAKSILLPKILLVAVRVIQKDAEEKKLTFNPRPYFRLFIFWLLDLTSSDVMDSVNFQVLTYFANAFHALQPLKVPGWSFAWLELVSHRSFMPKLLTCNSPKGWPFFQRLLLDLFKFMEPYLRNAELGQSVQLLYKGTLRVLLVLLHDFPEFLCDYHFSFCDVIPPSCIQLRNIILSAFPRNMRLPDPSTPNLKIDLLAEITISPRILSDVEGALKAKQLKGDLDEYLKIKPESSSFLADLKQRLLLPQSEANLAGTRYNVPLLNSLVLYVGIQAIQLLQCRSSQTQQVAHNPMDIFLVTAAMDIYVSLAKNLDTEGRYLFLNAIANQLRYPNNHTHYYSFVLLYLFAELNMEIIQEQITRVLLERLIVNRPHPWGLLITFIELIKNPRYSFWNRSFTRCAPDIEDLFDSVSTSCCGPKTVDDVVVAGGIPDISH